MTSSFRRNSGIAAALGLAAFLTIFISPASAAFGLKDLDVMAISADGSPATQAGSHPYKLTTTIDVNTEPNAELGFEIPQGAVRQLLVETPPGLVGNPTAVPRCSAADFLSTSEVGTVSKCPDASVVGVVKTTVLEPGSVFTSPVYNLVPPPGVAAKLGFRTLVVPATVELRVNPDPPHNVIASVSNIPQIAPFYSSTLELWGIPAAKSHDAERGNCIGPAVDTCPVGIAPKPFLTLPSSCTGPLPTGFEAISWDGDFFNETIFSHDNSIPSQPLGLTGCGNLGFAPQVSSQPTTQAAESPTGLDFNVSFDDPGLTSPTGTAQATIEKARVTLPEGVTLNPSAAEGLSACSEAQYEAESVESEPGDGCPQASKVGEVEVETPLLEGKLLRGSIYVAAQGQNPLNTRFAIYMVIKEPKLGILVKLPGKVEPDAKSGRLITTFGEAPYPVPQFPFSEFRFHFREGARSPLVTPPACGKYTTETELTPSSGAAPLHTTSTFEITTGVNGGACPSTGVPPFHPGFEAGSNNNAAGAYSPFYMHLTRADGEQDMTRFDAILPRGVSGKIAGVAKCPEAAIAAARLKTGREEIATPSCPAGSAIGSVMVGAGVGNSLTWVPGRIYLGGPLAGDPLSIIVVTPAVAGPFDLGTVVVREALTLNPETAEVEVDGANSEPIPHILEGIPLKLRDLRVHVDRPEFTLNPTSCEPSSVRATLFGSAADVFNPADDQPVALRDRYQAASCASLGFKPRLSLSLKGGTKRNAHPALTAILTAREGDAGIGAVSTTLPHTEFIDQNHISNPCTRVQFNAGACPPASILGTARAWTPLLAEPLEGLVYFRSNGGDRDLPDIVADVHGEGIHIVQVGFVDSVHARIRTRFLSFPDAPVSKVVLSLKGGKEGLLVNSANLCARTRRASLRFTGQNGRVVMQEPVIKASCKGKKK